MLARPRESFSSRFWLRLTRDYTPGRDCQYPAANASYQQV